MVERSIKITIIQRGRRLRDVCFGLGDFFRVALAHDRFFEGDLRQLAIDGDQLASRGAARIRLRHNAHQLSRGLALWLNTLRPLRRCEVVGQSAVFRLRLRRSTAYRTVFACCLSADCARARSE